MKSYIISIAVIAQMVERSVMTLMVKGLSPTRDRIFFLIIEISRHFNIRVKKLSLMYILTFMFWISNVT